MTALQRLLAFILLGIAVPAHAHPAPYSYLDLTLQSDRIDGVLTVHVIDVEHELRIDQADSLLDQRVLDTRTAAIQRLLDERMQIGSGSGQPLRWQQAIAIPGEQALRLTFVRDGPPPPALAVQANLFPYDPAHQTFVNIYEGGALAQQWILAPDDAPRTHYAGTVAGAWEVFKTFVPSGLEHILIGPDHVLFVIGLLLLGGSWRRLLVIVTAFTLGHSVTLALVALGVVEIAPAVIEPLIALTIVVVGLDNLLRLQAMGKGADPGRDLRAGLAVVFGLIHGFGFAYVLQQFGLPQGQLGLSLFAFNLGVELGQLVVVLPVAAALAMLGKRRPAWARHTATIGSLAVAAAGAYWFVDRVILGAGG